MTVASPLLRSRTALAAALVALLALLLAPLPAGSAGAPLRWIVPAGHVLPASARVVGEFPVADALVVSSPVAIPGAVRADAPIGSWKTLIGMPGEGGGRVDSAVATAAAPQAWSTTKGRQAVVALIDTGVAPIAALDGAVAGEIDFSGTGGGDAFGHGTFMASLIAGRGELPGVAPEAGILSLKVADGEGTTDLASVLGALQWLNGPGRAAGIRVAALALGVPPDSDAAELLDRATAHVASRGILMVTASGNDGPGNVTAPATSTGTFSVGAVDDKGDADRANDAAPSPNFSGDGPDRAGRQQPDAVASGVAVVGSINLDSAVATAPDNQGALVEGRYFRGSGTSMSTAIAAGVAALASSARPDVDGHALEAALRAGGGVIDAPSAVAAVQGAPRGNAPMGNEKATRGNGRANAGRPQGETDRWESEAVRWGAVRWGAVRWGAVRWGAVRWSAVRWSAVRWSGTHWGDAEWDMGTWEGVRWASTGWQGERWQSDAFTGVRWAGVRWALSD